MIADELFAILSHISGLIVIFRCHSGSYSFHTIVYARHPAQAYLHLYPLFPSDTPIRHAYRNRNRCHAMTQQDN